MISSRSIRVIVSAEQIGVDHGRRFHGDIRQLFQDVEHCGHYDYLFYGHTHQAKQHRTGPTLVVNPGALHRARVKTFVLLDLTNGELESVIVE